MLFKRKLPTKKNILIIGGNGFVGKYLCRVLKKKYNLYKISRNTKLGSLRCDITNYKKLNFELSKLNVNFNFVVNLSGQIEQNKKKLEKNIIKGNLNLIKYFNKKNTKIIFLSSALVYKSSKNLQSEKTKPAPSTHYGKLKLRAEKLYEKNSKNFLIIRSGNIYDDNLTKIGLFKNVYDAIFNDKKLIINNIRSNRPYIHIIDFCNLFLRVIKISDKVNKISINLCSENYTNQDILNLYEKILNTKIILINLKLDNKKDPNIKLKTINSQKFFVYKNKHKLERTLIKKFKNYEIKKI